METRTTWTDATTDPITAIIGLISCLESGKNAWIELRKNGDQDRPVMKKNPELDNPFNWTMHYGEIRNDEKIKKSDFFNETEKDLTLNWTACFGEEQAIRNYQEKGILSKGLIQQTGICHPVRIEDANRYRKEITGDNYHYEYWMTYWIPKDKIPYRIIDTDIGKVFTICYNDEPTDKVENLQKAAQFLMDYAEYIRKKKNTIK